MATLSKSNNRLQLYAPLLILGVGILWGRNPALLRDITWYPLAMVAGRAMVAFAFELPLLVWLEARRNHEQSLVKSLNEVRRRIFSCPEWAHWLSAGACTFNLIAFIFALKYAGATNVVCIQGCSFAGVAVFSGRWTKQYPTKQDRQAVGIALIGMAILAVDGFWRGQYTGIVISLLCATAITINQTCLKVRSLQPGPGDKALETFALTEVFGIILGTPFILCKGLPAASEGSVFFELAILCWLIPNVTYMMTIKYVPVYRAQLLTLANPISAPIWIAIRYGELPTKLSLFGAGWVVAAIAYFIYSRARAARHKESVRV